MWQNLASTSQMGLFGEPLGLPHGLRFATDLITPAEEAALMAWMAALPLAPFAYEGYEGLRRTVSYGWRFDFTTQTLHRGAPLPPPLLPLRHKAAAFAGLPVDDLQQALVTEYAPRAGIGWHRDRPMFGQIIGVSLGAGCTFRLRRRQGPTWQRAALLLEPRSVYVMEGEARDGWQHSIPPVERLRYSVTFRNMR